MPVAGAGQSPEQMPTLWGTCLHFLGTLTAAGRWECIALITP